MHDPKFEKEVQQKMAELEFSPSESVWANVEKEINQRRRVRRGFPFFWRLALPALLLAGGGYYFFRSKPAPVSPAYPAPVTLAHPKSVMPATSKDASGSTANANTANSVTANSLTTNSNTANNKTATRETATGAVSAPVSARSAMTAGPTTSSQPYHINKRTKRHPAVQSATEAQSGDLIAATSGNRIAATPGNDNVAMEPETKSGLVAVTTGPTSTGNGTTGRQSILFNPALANLYTSASPIRASKPVIKNTATINTLQSPHRPWEAAFSGGIGVSSLHQVQISNVTLNNAAANFSSRDSNSNNVTYAGTRPSKQYVSTVKPGVSFWAGVLAHKPLSDRWGLSIGLNLSYYSTRVRVGEQVDTYTPSTATLLASSAVAPIQSYPYYNTGNDQAYTNRYYFLELPVAAEWKINHSHLLPIFWDGGFSVSYLMGSSAVYYNTKSGVYFKDGGVANHAQVNISTALMVGLPVRGLRVQLGPQVQYGLTPLLNTELSGSQHIFYGGLRLVVYPGKK